MSRAGGTRWTTRSLARSRRRRSTGWRCAGGAPTWSGGAGRDRPAERPAPRRKRRISPATPRPHSQSRIAATVSIAR